MCARNEICTSRGRNIVIYSGKHAEQSHNWVYFVCPSIHVFLNLRLAQINRWYNKDKLDVFSVLEADILVRGILTHPYTLKWVRIII